MTTIGQNIAKYRKEKNFTQEQLAEICAVSPQAVSKWENDVSCPDVTLLKTIARTFSISVDQLLDDGLGAVIRLEEGSSLKDKFIKIRCVDGGDKINVNLPLALVELFLKNDNITEHISIGGKNSNIFKSIDFKQIFDMVSLGVMGKLIEVESEDGGTVEVWVE